MRKMTCEVYVYIFLIEVPFELPRTVFPTRDLQMDVRINFVLEEQENYLHEENNNLVSDLAAQTFESFSASLAPSCFSLGSN